jgi:hypothetical protein
VCQYRHLTGLLWGIYVRISDDRREGAGLGVKRQEKGIRAMIPRIDPGGGRRGLH